MLEMLIRELFTALDSRKKAAKFSYLQQQTECIPSFIQYFNQTLESFFQKAADFSLVNLEPHMTAQVTL